ncbi:hypothetical protein LCGC14_0397350 [marine sediment metagenome]|uniref:Uncharacterized protein n=1 Tax=marine sediment metagenome TaxID=412755 RepID=A0A0F9TG02_9ZZZZ
MGILDAAQNLLADDGIDGIVQDVVMCFSYLDKDGEELLSVALSPSKLTSRLGLIEYLHERHIWEMRHLFVSDDLDED